MVPLSLTNLYCSSRHKRREHNASGFSYDLPSRGNGARLVGLRMLTILAIKSSRIWISWLWGSSPTHLGLLFFFFDFGFLSRIQVLPQISLRGCVKHGNLNGRNTTSMGIVAFHLGRMEGDWREMKRLIRWKCGYHVISDGSRTPQWIGVIYR
ncbi:hypothetical protein BDV23DRAFT_35778 [Aspergillus alliaceus]|uniref:Uncharacterized protein n=1 Tax=Petromyces alliaceus TaxID=209559 RepID=A0A5N6G378_PETAA|nr:uncharacterized protein BDW43DRAFT_38189 [Aspergillus alliaceus]KAB8235063.1 hypothetical protein BDW43DRAFT_38189 [Aspergillus alliaceus]KAE8384512.1 hypothetical protein BDV23DRAFT_35778 [Aspergillus alliaceus]